MITVVVGPPCAGKSTYVTEHARSGDVRVDYDRIAQALGAEPSHASTGSVRKVALIARRAVIRSILTGLDDPSFIIHTRPTSEQIDSYNDAGARFVMLDPGKATCLSRAIADGRPESTSDVIDRWYADPPQIPGEQNE